LVGFFWDVRLVYFDSVFGQQCRLSAGLSVAVLVSERLGVGYRYDLEPYLGKVADVCVAKQ
jgi:hypothetical protein